MHQAKRREYSRLEGFAIFLAYIAIQLSSELIAGWGMYFYSPEEGGRRVVYVSVGLVSVIFLFGRLFDAITDPLIGVWSDKTSTHGGKWRPVRLSGRRRPFLFWGSLLMTVSGIAFWFPPVGGTSYTNLVFGTAIVSLHWAFFTLCQVPLDSLSPELARSQRGRIHIGQWRAAGLIVGLAMAAILPGELIRVLDPVESVEGVAASPAGYQRTAGVFAIMSLIFIQFAVWTIRERHDSSSVTKHSLPWEEIAEAAGNTVFLRYIGAFFLFNMGYLAVQKVLPYWVMLGVGGTEDTVSVIMIPFILSALFTALIVTPILSRYVPLKWMFVGCLSVIGLCLPAMYFIGIADASVATKIFWAQCLFAACGVGQGMQYALLTPLIGESIDLDAQRSGERREAVYNGLFGIAWKGSQALSVLVASQSMRWFGNTAENPMGVYLAGPIAGLFAILGLAIALTYPVLNVVPETPDELGLRGQSRNS